jgi:hypothetical protein
MTREEKIFPSPIVQPPEAVDIPRKICFNPFKDEAQTALFKDPVRTAQ